MEENTSWLKPHIRLAILYTFFSSFFNLLPLLLGAFFSTISSTWQGWYEFYKNGEFFIYATSNLSAAFLVYYSYKKQLYDTKSYLGLVCMALIVVLSSLYAFKATFPIKNLNVPFFAWTSWISLFISFGLFYYSQIIVSKSSPDIAEQRHEEQDEIMNSIS